MKKTVLVTFGRSFLSLACTRMLASAGHRVIAVDSVDYAVCKYSNSVDTFYKVPSPRKHPSAYVDSLVNIAQQENVDLIIPMWEDIAHVSHASDRFPRSCALFCPAFELYDILLNKMSFQRLLEVHHIIHPKTELIHNADELKALKFTKPVILKPSYSRASQHIHKLIPGEPLPEIRFAKENPWVAQEWIDGSRYCTYSVCRDGVILGHATYPVRHTVDGHSCLTFLSVEHKQIFAWVESFIKRVSYTGQIAFDFIETPEGVLHAIECNPRATSGILLFRRHEGFDKVFFREASGVLLPRDQASRQVAIGMVLYGWKRKGGYPKKLSTYFKDLMTTPDVIFSRRDPVPFLMQPYIFTKFLFGCRQAGLSLSDFYIDDHIWDGTADQKKTSTSTTLEGKRS